MAGRFLLPRATAFDENGNPIAGAKLEFFESGTTTQQATYSDDALTVPNTNPVIADSAGRFGDIFLLAADYKVTLSDADDVVIWTADPVRSQAPKSTVVVSVTTTTQLTVANDGNLIAADATAGAFIVTLPAAATAGDGYEVTVMKVDSSANIVTVDGSGSETINGSADLNLTDQYASAVFRCDGTTWYASAITQTSATRVLPRAYIDGFGLANNSGDAEHDIDIALGTARNDADGANIVLTTGITKQIDAAFAEGTNQGGLDTGVVAADTLYYVWAIAKADGTADALFSLSSSSPTMPSGFSSKRRIGIVRTNPSSNLYAFEWQESGAYRWFFTDTGFTSHDFLGIPSGVTRFDFSFGMSSNTGGQIGEFQIGDAGGIETTGYTGNTASEQGTASGEDAVTTAFRLVRTGTGQSAANTMFGNARMVLINSSTNLWTWDSQNGDGGQIHHAAGGKALSEELDRFRLTTAGGTATYDVMDLMYQFSGYPNPRDL